MTAEGLTKRKMVASNRGINVYFKKGTLTMKPRNKS